MPPTVSVIIPCYNQARYLPSSVGSVIAQTCHDWEVIVVDDGSTDDTRRVALAFENPKIRYLYQPNQGLSAARNTAIREARGEYLSFLDSDDELEPAFLQVCVEALTSDDTLAAVYAQTRFIDESGKVLPRISGQALSGDALHRELMQGGFFPPVAVVARRAVVLEAGLFDAQLTGVGDWDLWLRVSARYTMRGLPLPLVRYRVYPGSMSTNAERMHADRLKAVAKQVGPAEGEPSTWPEPKRSMYGFAYRLSALEYIEQKQPDKGWSLLNEAVHIWPPLLARLDTFYEIACGAQNKGYRGQAELLDISGNGADLLRRLDALFANAHSSLKPLQPVAYGCAFLALAMLSDQAGSWNTARYYLLRAVKANPRLLGSSTIVRRLAKLLAGQRMVHFLRRTIGGSRLGERQPS